MDQFFIVRKYGNTIWMDVDKGYVKRFWNETPKFITAMNNLYLGCTISFVDDDFMFEVDKGEQHEMKVNSLTNLNLKVQPIINRIKFVNNILKKPEITKHVKTDMEGRRFRLIESLSNLEMKIEIDKKRIKDMHNFTFK